MASVLPDMCKFYQIAFVNAAADSGGVASLNQAAEQMCGAAHRKRKEA